MLMKDKQIMIYTSIFNMLALILLSPKAYHVNRKCFHICHYIILA
jgi:hypothetical protein